MKYCAIVIGFLSHQIGTDKCIGPPNRLFHVHHQRWKQYSDGKEESIR